MFKKSILLSQSILMLFVVFVNSAQAIDCPLFFEKSYLDSFQIYYQETKEQLPSFYFPQVPQFSPTVQQESVFLESHQTSDAHKKLIQFNQAANYRTNRGLSSHFHGLTFIPGYLHYFNNSLHEALVHLNENEIFFDSGGGEGYALEEYLDLTPYRNTMGIVYTLEAPDSSLHQMRKYKYKDRYHHSFGPPIEILDLSNKKKPSIITDVFGPMTYSARPDLVLAKYLSFLKKGGSIFMVNHENHKQPSMVNQTLSLNKWISSIPNLYVLQMVDRGAIEVKIKDQNQRVVIPELELLDVDLPYSRTFRTTGREHIVYPYVENRIPDSQYLSVSLETLSVLYKKNAFFRVFVHFHSGSLTELLSEPENALNVFYQWVYKFHQKELSAFLKNIEIGNEPQNDPQLFYLVKELLNNKPRWLSLSEIQLISEAILRADLPFIEMR